jgi:signal transduction histidine kinase/ActR/RegA family two-component response regulator
MPQHYHHGLVLLSLVVAILASYTALTFALRIRVASKPSAPAWLAGGGFVMGTGIWAMHFVGMLAMSLPIEIAYDFETTLASLVIAIAVSTFALHIASRDRVRRAAMVSAGIAMGVGICAMHYVGMAAIQIEPPIRYNAVWVAVSFAIAIAASFAALGIAFSADAGAGWRRYRRFVGAVGMGVAITGMHYAGMIAAQFPAHAVSATTWVEKGWLAGSVATITLFVLFAALLLSFVEGRAAERAASMQASIDEVKESSRAKDEFLAMLGHELRTPLAAISNAIYLLERNTAPGGEDWRIARDVISRQSRHLTNIVDDLLDVGRAITGKMPLHRLPLDLHAAVAESLNALEAAGKTANRRVEYRGASVWVEADRTRIEQVVSNLVSNAVQQTAPGGRIKVRVRIRSGAAELRVSDDGVGMDAEILARAFELFFQARQDAARGKGGLGIGLTLVRRIAELHGGSIAAASDGPGRGATFTLRLPVVEAPQETATPAEAAVRGARSVVIVEDSLDTRLSLTMALRSAGHTVHAAVDGPGGFDSIARLRPDVALVDIGLPGYDGYQLAARLRSAGLATYLVALTGYGLEEDKSRARDAGFDAHLTKPAPMPRLLQMIAEAAPTSDARSALRGSDGPAEPRSSRSSPAEFLKQSGSLR